LTRKISTLTACAIVIANMIGTGVFTSLGFQLSAIQNTWSIILLWSIGGLLALFGAFAYAELGTHFKDSGGDYIFLSRVFHPLLGYLSAWAGLTVGFAAPVALAAMAFTKYMSPLGWQSNSGTAIGIICMIGFLHSFTIRHSSRLQNFSTLVKIIFILTLIVLGVFLPGAAENALNYNDGWTTEIVKPGFAVSMVYVSFDYTGWNSAAYVVDEIRDPRRTLPIALIGSTIFVAAVYIMFQVVLLKNATTFQLIGKEDVSFIAFENLLGKTGGKWVSIFIALQLIATISSYLGLVPRVTCAMAKENKLWYALARKNSSGIPVPALWVHVILSVLLTLSGSFEKVLLYAGFVLQLMASLAVAASLFLKNPHFKTFKSPLKPLFQVIFLVSNGWVLIYTLIDRPRESFIGLSILLAGVVLYYFDKPRVEPTKPVVESSE
jgi:APA family basic amino acid/polyamine antiporter